MMEWRLGLALGLCGALGTAIACTGSEGTGDDGDDAPTMTAGTANVAGSSAGGSPGGASAGRGGSSMGATGGNGVGGSGVAGMGMGGSAGTSTAGSGSGGTGGIAGECVDTEPPLCLDETNIRACLDGSYETFSCADFCENDIHFQPGPCDTSINDCKCGAPLSAECALGTNALCFCLSEAGEPCTDPEAFSAYIGCYEDEPELATAIKCFGQQVVGADTENPEIDCAAAADTCLPAAMPEPDPAP